MIPNSNTSSNKSIKIISQVPRLSHCKSSEASELIYDGLFGLKESRITAREEKQDHQVQENMISKQTRKKRHL